MREIFRKGLHMLLGSVFVALTAALGGGPVALLCALAFSVGVLLTFLHQRGIEIPVFKELVAWAGRRDEHFLPAKGALYFFLGAALVLGVLAWLGAERVIEVAALIPLVYGDGISAMVGVYHGRVMIAGKKSLEGTLAGFAVTAVILYALVLNPVAAVLVALATSVVELLPINDNISIPIISGALLYLLV